MTYHFIGLDLGGTKITAGLTDTDCVLGRKIVLPVDRPEDFEDVVEAMADLAREVASPLPAPAILGVGVAVSGLVDRESGVVRWSPNLGWRNAPLRAALARRLPWDVFVGNDMNLATLGEWSQGAGRGACCLLGVFVGTGIGAGLVLDGRPYEGAHGFAGAIGHSCSVALHLGQVGECRTLETWAAGPVLSGRAAEACRTGEAAVMRPDAGGRVSPEEIGRAEAEGDPAALRIVGEAAEALGLAVADASLLVDPERVILGGGVVRAIPTLVARVREVVRRRYPQGHAPPEVVAASLGREAPVVGAAVLVRLGGELRAAARRSRPGDE
ncbi:MAG: ROK family protein [Candidatus Sericytochromatia bacterium]|nr:ROK family protein [Candidatus Tanganyikabacteria bacterium]